MRISDWSSDVCSSDLVAARSGVKRCCRNQKRSVGEEMIILRRQCRSQLFVEFGAFYRTGLQHNSPLLICSAASSCRVKGELGSIPPIIAADRKSTRLNSSQ